MAFLVVVGGLQFVYCVIAGNYVGFPPSLPTPISLSRFFLFWVMSLEGNDEKRKRGNIQKLMGLVNLGLIFQKQPFNAFLSGFSATVGQFVLTASLRIQTNPENEGEFGGSISHER